MEKAPQPNLGHVVPRDSVLWHSLKLPALHFVIVDVAGPSLPEKEGPLLEFVDFGVSNSISQPSSSGVRIVPQIRDDPVRGMEQAFDIKKQTLSGFEKVAFSSFRLNTPQGDSRLIKKRTLSKKPGYEQCEPEPKTSLVSLHHR